MLRTFAFEAVLTVITWARGLLSNVDYIRVADTKVRVVLRQTFDTLVTIE